MGSERPKMPSERPRVMVVGVGNEYRRDDGVGLVVARKISERLADKTVRVIESDGGAGLIEAWKDADAVIVIDAVSSGGEAGRVYCFDARQGELPAHFFQPCSTHGFNVADTIELARLLGKLPPRLLVYGIEGKDFKEGRGLSPEVGQASRELAQRLIEDVQSLVGQQI
jgi:hydrogenase maturation protease